MEENIHKMAKYFNHYNVAWIGAKRSSKFGRASGGVMIGCRLGISCNFERCSEFDYVFVNVKFDNKCYLIFPMYLQGSEWHNNFSNIFGLISNNLDYECILIGDANVRIGELQNIPDELFEGVPAVVSSFRSSKDLKMNGFGGEFVDSCNELGLVIMNGRSVSDSEGQYTFIGACGASVNDICGVSLGMLSDVEDYEVRTELFSDHMPIVLTIRGGFREGNDCVPLLPRAIWKGVDKRCYNDKLSCLLTDYYRHIDIDMKEELIISSIREAAGRGIGPVSLMFELDVVNFSSIKFASFQLTHVQ